MHPEDDALRREDAYWDALVRGQVPSEAIEPATAEAIARTHAQDDAARPDPSFVKRLKAQIVEAAAATGAHVPEGDAAVVRLNGHAPGVRPSWEPHPATASGFERPRAVRMQTKRWRFPISAQHRRGAMNAFSLAAVLLLMLGGIWLAFERNGDQYGTNSNDVRVEITGPIPPLADNPVVRLLRISLEPGVSFVGSRYGPTLILAESGTFSLSAYSGELRATLKPGDSATATALTTVVLRNDAPVTGTFLIAQVYPNVSATSGLHLAEGATASDLAFARVSQALSTATFSLRKVTLAPGERLDPWQTHGQTWITASESSLGLTIDGEDVPGPSDAGWERTMDPGVVTAIPDHTTVDAGNAGVTPVVVTILTIAPPDEATSP